MSMEEDKAEFVSMFAAKFASNATPTKRIKSERTAAMTEKQHARLGRARPVQVNFRTSADCKALAVGLADHMKVSVAEMFEEALALLAKKKGYSEGGE